MKYKILLSTYEYILIGVHVDIVRFKFNQSCSWIQIQDNKIMQFISTSFGFIFTLYLLY